MEEKKVSTLKTWLNFGFITALLLIAIDLVFYVIDLPRESYIRLVSILVFIGGIIWASKSYRDTKAGGLISYGKALSVGFMTGFWAAIILTVYVFIFFSYVDPGMIQELIDKQELQLLERYPNMTDAEIEQALAMSAKFMTPPMMALMGLLWNAVVVLIISLIVSIFIKKEEKVF